MEGMKSNTKQGTKKKSNPHRTGLFKKGKSWKRLRRGSRLGPMWTAIAEHLLVRAGRAEEACSGLPPTLRERTAGVGVALGWAWVSARVHLRKGPVVGAETR